MIPDPLDTIQAEYQAAQMAFERGEYRQSVERLERARSLVDLNSALGGEIQIWLVTAYEAFGDREAAIALCRKLTHHPTVKTRKEGKRILYVLEAPQLRTRPDWLTQIPDLATLTGDDKPRYTASSQGSSVKQPDDKPNFQLEPVDLSQVNTEDNRFIWLALGAGVLIVGGLIWFG